MLCVGPWLVLERGVFQEEAAHGRFALFFVVSGAKRRLARIKPYPE
jgi:hypothetical protein